MLFNSKLRQLLAGSVLAAASLTAAPLVLAAETVSVAITQIVEHPALDAIRQGVKDELAERGYVEGQNLKWNYESAQGSPATAAQIAKKFAGDAPNVIVAITTPSAQTAVSAARGIPVVFSAVTDPVGAKLVKGLDQPTRWVTGTTDMLPMGKHMDLVKQIVPSAKTVGVIFNPGEANSVSSVQQVHDQAPARGLKVVEAAATKSADVLAAARSLVGKVDVIYLPIDNTVISALEAVLKVAEQADIPVIAGDTDSVNRGAIAAVGFNYYQVGRQTGVMVERILKGESPKNMPVEGVEKMELFLNPKAAERMGITLSPELLQQAKQIVD
ncbi:putative ABC transport system substrate-binding protein [Oceanospirillum multiglobuliferum]|uniref:ABC transporter permease n=1 Tax=Oceanospirillum multiglobuliferum TaxID=64969 RepID=A0A1T4NPV6_9GAMM|nr:ABC transporter substrate-binding protein [Oceanospirillum multiglobuliferum]OPX55722.1 ABC transporter permease [Oceanospirillum multiglobuliferum]SJZ81243.1 putative ABC transport system substrate-binding protein [Oceanospirillum multiglobuliferum]